MKITPENITKLKVRIKKEDINRYLFTDNDAEVFRGNDLTIGEITEANDTALYYKGEFYRAWIPLCHLEFVDTVDITR